MNYILAHEILKWRSNDVEIINFLSFLEGLTKDKDIAITECMKTVNKTWCEEIYINYKNFDNKIINDEYLLFLCSILR